MAERTAKTVAKARTRTSLQALDKLTTVVDGERRFISDPPLIVPVAEVFPEVESQAIMDQLDEIVRGYGRSLQSDRRHLLEEFRLVQVARKVVGVGSVGTRAWVLLLVGRDNDDSLLLQAKEAEVLGARGVRRGERYPPTASGWSPVST